MIEGYLRDVSRVINVGRTFIPFGVTKLRRSKPKVETLTVFEFLSHFVIKFLLTIFFAAEK